MAAWPQEARGEGGRVLLHCSQGVSRSAALAIAHHMWRTGQTFDEAFAAVKAQRGIANPNIGFTCQVGAAPPLAPCMHACMRRRRIPQ